MPLPAKTILPDVIGLSDKDYHSAATFICDWSVNSAINVSLSNTAFQGSPLIKKFNRLLINNSSSKDFVVVSYLGISLSVNPFQQQNISLPDKVSSVTISGTSGTCKATLSNGGELIGDTLNAYQSQINAGSSGLFGINKYTASVALTINDLNKTIIVSAATQQNLTFQAITSSPIPNGALVVVENIGAASWTLTPNILDNFREGVAGATITLLSGESVFISCNGSSTWYYFRVPAPFITPSKHTTVITATSTFTTNANHKYMTVTAIGSGAAGRATGTAGVGDIGGGAGAVALKTYTSLLPSTGYAVAIGAASSFNDSGSTFINAGSGSGQNGGVTTGNPDFAMNGGNAGGSALNFSGAGGSNMFAQGGMSVYSTTALIGKSGTGFGAGASGSVGTSLTAAGLAGAVIIDEWY